MDKECKATETNAMADAMGVWLDVSIQPYAGMVLPFVGVIADTDWLGQLVFPTWKGFLWKKTLAGFCREGTDLDPQVWVDWLNNKFQQITASVNDVETHEQNATYDIHRPDWQEWKEDHPGDDSPRPKHVPSQSACLT